MNKTKVKLNSLYGQMTSGATAFGVCSRKVREIPCAQCLNFERCMCEGKPVSPMGAYIAWLNLYALRIIESKLSPICGSGLHLEAFVPLVNENAFVVIRGYDRKNCHKRVCRVLLEEAVRDIEQLTEMVLQDYVSKKGKSRQ